MESSSQNKDQIYDAIRMKWVAAAPEEKVRQALIQKMIKVLNYPKELIAVEVSLSELPPLFEKSASRRADIIVYGKNIHPQHALYPLLLVECKEVKADRKAMDQLIGYNHFVKAPFIALSTASEILTGFKKGLEGYQFISYLPSYEQLIAAVK